jgi:hypothetical protein
MRRRGEFDSSELVQKYAEYEAVRSSLGPWGALLIYKIPTIIGIIFAVYMLHAKFTGQLHEDYQPTPEIRAKLEANGWHFDKNGVPISVYHDADGNFVSAQDAEGNSYHEGPNNSLIEDK